MTLVCFGVVWGSSVGLGVLGLFSRPDFRVRVGVDRFLGWLRPSESGKTVKRQRGFVSGC